MLVTVIIPNYNHARFLRQRIDSVLLQTYQEFELIIMDDSSKDDSRDIIEEYKNNKKIVKIVFNEKNSGSTFKQWKNGVKLAKGEWIWIAESDDWCDSSLLATLVAKTRSYPNISIAYCQSYHYEEGNSIVEDMSFHTNPISTSHWKEDYTNTGVHEIKNFLLYRNTIPNASAVLFKKSAYIEADKAFEQMKLCGDWMLWVQLLKVGDIAFCAKPLNNFRAHISTTRVLDTLQKKRLRLEEEYKVMLDIKNTFRDIEDKADGRMEDILSEYILCMESNKSIIFPHLYEGKIPYMEVLIFKLKRLFS